MAADTTLKVEVDTQSAQASLSKLESKFQDLKSAILGVGFAAAIQQANAYANEVKDISETSDLAVASVIGLSKAFQVNGGTAEGARMAILKFSDTVGQAIAGSDTAQKSFKDVGISLQDIQKLSQQELLAKAVDGVSKIESAAQRIRVQTDLFGKTAKGVSFPGVADVLGSSTDSATKYESAIKAGSDASENLNKQLGNLKQALLNVAEPLNKIAASASTSVSAFESLIKALALAGGAFLILTKGVAIIDRLMKGWAGFAAGAAAGGGLIAATFGGIVASVEKVFERIGRLGATTAAGISTFGQLGLIVGTVIKGLFRFAGVVGLIWSVTEAVDFLIKKLFDFSVLDWVADKFTKVKNAAKEFFGIKPDMPNETDAETKRLQERARAIEEAKKKQEEAAAKAKEFAERTAKLRDELSKVGDEYKKSNVHQLERLALETKLIGKTDDEKEVVMALADLYDKQRDTIDQLIQKRREWAKGTEEQRANLGIIDAEIARVKDLTRVQAEALPKYIADLQGARLLEEDRKRTIENITKAIEDQTRRQEALTQARLGITGKMQDVGFETSQMNRSPLQRQIAQIQEESRKAALEAGRAYAAAFEDTGDGMTPERAQELADGLDAIAQGYKNISDAQLSNLEQSRSWTQGWKDAFNEYVDNANNAAQQAKTYFDSFAKGFEDAIVALVTNGKWSFKDFANSIIADFARIEARKLLTGSMNGTGGSVLGSLFTYGKSLFGFAAGGQTDMSPMIVGERGPELFIPKSAGQIIPNNQLGSSRQEQQPVTVNYNIQAVDAASFRSLVARDPGFIYAVTEQGRRSQPSRRVA